MPVLKTTAKPTTSGVGQMPSARTPLSAADDPGGLEKIGKEAGSLQAAQERDKALNTYYRKNKTVKGFEASATKVRPKST